MDTHSITRNMSLCTALIPQQWAKSCISKACVKRYRRLPPLRYTIQILLEDTEIHLRYNCAGLLRSDLDTEWNVAMIHILNVDIMLRGAVGVMWDAAEARLEYSLSIFWVIVSRYYGIIKVDIVIS